MDGRLALFILGIALVMPTAVAAPADGRFEAASARLLGDVTATSSEVGWSWASDRLPSFTLTAADVTVERIGSREVEIGSLFATTAQPIHDTERFGDATVTLAPGVGVQRIAALGTGQGSFLTPQADVRPVGAVLIFTLLDGGDTDSCAAAYCLAMRGVYEISRVDGAVDLVGDIDLRFFGPSVNVAAGGAERTFASGTRVNTDGGVVRDTENTYVTIRATNAHLTVTGAESWFVRQPDISASRVELADATGSMGVGIREYRASGESVAIDGSLGLVLGIVDEAVSHGSPDENGFAPPVYAANMNALVTGDVSSINLRAVPVYTQVPAAPFGIAAFFAAALAVAAYFWPRIAVAVTTAAIPLYSRLKQPEILLNEVRNRIFEIIRDNPGISAREIHRRSEQSWGTVVYHLRQLERHQLVVSRSVGRTRNYYENHGKYRGMEVQLACLQSGRARALAHIVMAAPGIAQEDLVARSGFPQPTTSYYVRKLKVAALVEERREGRYARYYPHAELARFLALAEHAPPQPEVGFGSAGIDA